jgi:hypothetical protein
MVYIKLEFVHSAENDTDLITKNANQELYEKHKKKFLEVKFTAPVDRYRIDVRDILCYQPFSFTRLGIIH